jgi:hypothetical protein
VVVVVVVATQEFVWPELFSRECARATEVVRGGGGGGGNTRICLA